MVKRSRRFPPPSCRCSNPTATAEDTLPSAVPPLANGNCPWARQSAGRGCSRSTSSHAARRAAKPLFVSPSLSADGCIHVQVSPLCPAHAPEPGLRVFAPIAASLVGRCHRGDVLIADRLGCGPWRRIRHVLDRVDASRLPEG